MATLVKVAEVEGGTVLHESDPKVLHLNDVIYVPLNDPTPAGIFSANGKLVPESWYWRQITSFDTASVSDCAYSINDLPTSEFGDDFIYGGWLHHHFGHFLLSSLSRFWAPEWREVSRPKILYHDGVGGVENLFGADWSAAIMRNLGLSPDDFISLSKPTRIPHLVIPAPAFVEESFSHRAFATLCNGLGQRIAGQAIGKKLDRPVYLSKENLARGVHRLDNEDEISRILDKNGVEIICPETLSFSDQIALWYNRRNLASFAGSALHTSIFCPKPTYVGLNFTRLLSNYVLCDLANNASAQHYRLEKTKIVELPATAEFSRLYRAADPAGIAECILRVFDADQGWGRTQSRSFSGWVAKLRRIGGH